MGTAQRIDPFRDRLALYVSDDLPAWELDEVRAHVRGCDPCRQELEVYRRHLEALRSLRRDRAPLSPFFWTGIRRAVREMPVPYQRWERRWLYAAAAAVVLFCVGLIGVSHVVWSPEGRPSIGSTGGDGGLAERPEGVPDPGRMLELPLPPEPIGDVEAAGSDEPPEGEPDFRIRM